MVERKPWSAWSQAHEQKYRKRAEAILRDQEALSVFERVYGKQHEHTATLAKDMSEEDGRDEVRPLSVPSRWSLISLFPGAD
jgi:hypothetical protein